MKCFVWMWFLGFLVVWCFMIYVFEVEVVDLSACGLCLGFSDLMFGVWCCSGEI